MRFGEPNDYPYKEEYPETVLPDLLLSFIIFFIFIGASVGATMTVISELFYMFTGDFLFGLQIERSPEIFQIPTVVYATLLGLFTIGMTIFMFKLFKPVFKRTFSRVRTISPTEWTLTYIRRLIVHFFVGEIFMYAWFIGTLYGFYLLFSKVVGLGVIISLVVTFFAFSFVTATAITFVFQTSLGEAVATRFFELTAGYSDGKIGLNMHVANKSIEDVYDTGPELHDWDED